MENLKKCLNMFHTVSSFKKHGLKQVSTWIGAIIFIFIFDNDLLTLIHNVLTSENLAEKIATGLAGLVLVGFNRLENK